jgi:hypothetical protein
MTHHARSQLDLISTFTWPPLKHSPRSTIDEVLHRDRYSVFGQIDRLGPPTELDWTLGVTRMSSYEANESTPSKARRPMYGTATTGLEGLVE